MDQLLCGPIMTVCLGKQVSLRESEVPRLQAWSLKLFSAYFWRWFCSSWVEGYDINTQSAFSNSKPESHPQSASIFIFPTFSQKSTTKNKSFHQPYKSQRKTDTLPPNHSSLSSIISPESPNPKSQDDRTTIPPKPPFKLPQTRENPAHVSKTKYQVSLSTL